MLKLLRQLVRQLAPTILLLGATGLQSLPADQAILLQSTTSTANSGLYDHILPLFESDSGIKVKVVAVGTGQALKNARNCDATVLIVHAEAAEQRFVDEGYGVERFDLMYNDFVIVGPQSDPAGIVAAKDVVEALQFIADGGAIFASRADNSGTHTKEISLWRAAAIDATAHSGKWYRETGSGMGATLNTGVGMGAYVLTDRATWISYRNKKNYKILVQGDKALFNQYGVILVSPDKCPNTNAALGQQFIDWLLSETGQRAIADFRLNDQQLFYPNAQPDHATGQ